MARRDEPVIASKDVTITDDRGLTLQIVAGTTVPAQWVKAYESAGGKTAKAEVAPERDKAQRAPSTTK